ncbi:MAG: ABC transporter permease [Planctomycetota bacterium]|jgi:putative ABC transport system permease protein
MSAFLRLLTYVRRTILRARTRSVLTIVGTALALGLFAFVRTLEAGVDRLAEGSNVPILVVFQSSRFCPLTSQLPMYYADEIERMEGVASVLPTLLYTNSCRANLDLVTLHGIQTEGLTDIYDLTATSGDLESWTRRDNGALVGQRLAQRRGIQPGDRLRLGNVDVEVGGIMTSAGGMLDNLAFVHLDQLQLARKQQGKATEFLVKLEPGVNPNVVADRIDEEFRRGHEQETDTKTMQAFVQGAVGEIGEVVGFARILGYLAVAVVILILGNTVWISAHTRIAEFGVMQTVGATKVLVAALVLVEGLVLSLLGGLLGIGLVFLALHLYPQTLGIEGYGIDLIPDASIVVFGVVLAAVVGVLASLGPAVEIIRRPLALSVKPA